MSTKTNMQEAGFVVGSVGVVIYNTVAHRFPIGTRVRLLEDQGHHGRFTEEHSESWGGELRLSLLHRT